MAGRLDAALRWSERALRLAPAEDTLRLTLATLQLAVGDRRALASFAAIAARHDLREAWLGLAAARRLAGDARGAGEALAGALSRAVLAPGAAAIADSIAEAAGAPGWCGLVSRRLLRLGGSVAAPVVTLDGEETRLAPAGEPGLLLLPPRALQARLLGVSVDGRALLGSPVQLDFLRRVEGFVELESGGLRGWAWHPADPDRDPVLTVCFGHGPIAEIVASEADGVETALAPLARPRAFRLRPEEMPQGAPLIHVRDDSGRDLLGSPLFPGAERSAVPHRPRRGPGPRREADIVMPVYRGYPETLACLDSVLATISPPTRLIVVDDCSPHPELRAALDVLGASGQIQLIRNGANRGFPASANAGISASGQRDVVLLNSDTLVAPHWLERLRDAAYAEADIGTASPLSNEATILSYPDPSGGNPMPDAEGTARMARLAHRANAGVVIPIPTSVGFCMYLRRDCLDAVGLFREDLFAHGYGEENDFCMRARGGMAACRGGWRLRLPCGGAFVRTRPLPSDAAQCRGA